MKIAILPGDGIGTEIMAEALKALACLDLPFEFEEAKVGGAAYEAHGHPLPDSTLNLAKSADAVLFGAVGDWKYDKLERPLRTEAGDSQGCARTSSSSPNFPPRPSAKKS